MRGLPVGAVHPNRRGECDHVMKEAIEVNPPYLRDQMFATPERSWGRQVAAATAPQKRGRLRRCSRSISAFAEPR